jgi:acyl carrier protein
MCDGEIGVTEEMLLWRNVEPEAFDPDTKVIDIAIEDCLEKVEYILAWEEWFGVAIPDEAAHELHTLRDVVRHVEHCRKARQELDRRTC